MNMNAIVNAGVSLELEVDRLLDPAQFWDHPRDVVDDPFLSLSEKKAILSSWASDQCAVASNPVLRQPQRAVRPVMFEEVMDALKKLDKHIAAAPQPLGNKPTRSRGRSGAPA